MRCLDIFVQPRNPGATFNLSDPPPSAAVIGSLTRKHAEDLRVFNEYHNVNRASKKLLFSLVPNAYYRSFKNNYTGYSTVPCLTILTHLWTTYGELQDYEVQENDQQTKAPITDETLFKDLVQKIEVAVDAVASQVPYTAA